MVEVNEILLSLTESSRWRPIVDVRLIVSFVHSGYFP